MTLFGTTLDPMQVFGLVSLLMMLALLAMRLKGERSYLRRFRAWEAERKARRDAELAAERGEDPTTGPKRGPWG